MHYKILFVVVKVISHFTLVADSLAARLHHQLDFFKIQELNLQSIKK